VRFIASILLLACACGCASYTTLQVDTFYSGTNIVRQATTRVTVRTFASAKSDLTKSSVTQASHSMTNMMQYSRVGSVSQFATNNLPEIVKEGVEGAIIGAKAFP
jgi:hypothetical protein